MIPRKAFEMAEKGGYRSETPYVFWQIHALKPEFFQALGKALGWNINPVTQYITLRGKTILIEPWRHEALMLYDLILQGKDTTAFWQELLGNPSEE